MNRPPSRALRLATGFGYLGGAIAWTLHFLTSYAIAEFGCVARDPVRYAGITDIAWLLLAITAILALVAAASVLVALRLRPREDDVNTKTPARAYLARSGALLSGLFLLIILIETIPVFFYLESC